MWYTIQLLIYSFLIIFICHNIYIFYKDNIVENTYYDSTINNNNNKKDNNNDNNDNNDNSNTMKNELQNFLNNQIKNDDINDYSNASNDVGTTSIEDIPVSA
tara:strand:+ start:316 stop:621 length:306 start_codon:yes stop_codon:yes gene_type:complete